MISLRSLSLCAFVLTLVPAFASADEPSPVDRARRQIDDGLLKPLAHLEGHTFSRSRPPPRERRVRLLQTTVTLDKNGRAFVPFAIDVRFGSDDWHENDIVGCAYARSGKLFVKRGDAYRPASFLFGKNEDAVAGVCEAEAAQS